MIFDRKYDQYFWKQTAVYTYYIHSIYIVSFDQYFQMVISIFVLHFEHSIPHSYKYSTIR